MIKFNYNEKKEVFIFFIIIFFNFIILSPKHGSHTHVYVHVCIRTYCMRQQLGDSISIFIMKSRMVTNSSLYLWLDWNSGICIVLVLNRLAHSFENKTTNSPKYLCFIKISNSLRRLLWTSFFFFFLSFIISLRLGVCFIFFIEKIPLESQDYKAILDQSGFDYNLRRPKDKLIC